MEDLNLTPNLLKYFENSIAPFHFKQQKNSTWRKKNKNMNVTKC